MKLYSQKKIIYLVSSHVSRRDYERLGIKNWIDNGWKVEVFDITKFFLPTFSKYQNENKSNFYFEGLSIFQNINEVLFTLKNLQDKVVFIDNIGFSSTEQRIRRAARNHGVLVRIKLGSIPISKNKRNIPSVLNLITNPISLFDKIISFFKNKIEKIAVRRYFSDYIVVGGIKSMSGINVKKTSIIKAHNMDYDIFIQEKITKLNKQTNSTVFIDGGGAYHSDNIRFGVTPGVTADNYYPVINSGLSEIEKSLKLNIKIAAHPKSNFSIIQKKYNHPIFENKTFELIRDANVVVSHSSTALQWAVIMKKPIIIVTTDEIQNATYAKNFKNSIEEFAAILGKRVVNLSQLSSINNWKDYLNVDDKKYEKYIENYVKTKGSPEKLVWNIVIEYIEKDLF